MKNALALSLLLSTAALIAGCGPAAAPAELAVVSPGDVWCRPTPKGRDVSGCYLTLTSSRDDRLTSVASPAAAQVQIHEMKIDNGIMSMTELKDGLPLPAGEAVALQPGGAHLMLIGLTGPLAAGDVVSMTLTFAHAGPVGVRAQVRQPGAAGHSGH